MDTTKTAVARRILFAALLSLEIILAFLALFLGVICEQHFNFSGILYSGYYFAEAYTVTVPIWGILTIILAAATRTASWRIWLRRFLITPTAIYVPIACLLWLATLNNQPASCF